MSSQTGQILAVCTGNTCRSPLAEYLLRQYLRAQPGWTVTSAGVMAGNGQSASEGSITVLAERKIDASAHRSRQLTREMVAEADYVLVMTQGHRDRIVAEWPELADKVHCITSFGVTGESEDIADPIGQSVNVYRYTRDQIDAAIADFLSHLANTGKISSSP